MDEQNTTINLTEKKEGFKILKIVSVVVLLFWLAWCLIYIWSTEQLQEDHWTTEGVVQEQRMKYLEEQFQEVNNRLDWVEKVLINAQEEKEELLRQREEIQSEVKKVFQIREPWQVTEDGLHQVMPTTTWSDSHERFKQLAYSYWLDPALFWEVENHYWLVEWLVLCTSIAETSGGKKGAGVKNIGNVWNTDSNPRGQSYSNIWASLDAIGRTLNNGYLWSKKTLGCLSNAWHCTETNDNGKRYASSNGNRERNQVACLETIYGKWTVNPSTFNIRR